MIAKDCRNLFPHGIASGDVTADSIVLWTRVPEANHGAEVEWWLEQAFDDERISGAVPIEPARDFTVHLKLTGLNPDTAYRYGFRFGDTSSSVGCFRTLPNVDGPLRFAVVACAKYNAGFFNAYRRIAAIENLHFVLHLGDYIYETANMPPASQTPGANIGRDFDPLEECKTGDQYRRRYAQYRLDEDVQALHAAHAIIATIDDHELADNAWAGGADEHNEQRDGPWSERMSGALSAWEDWMPVDRRPSRGEPIWIERSVGKFATIAILETRTNRAAPRTAEEARDLLGIEQATWVEELLTRNSSSGWFVLGLSSMVTPIWSETLDDDCLAALKTLKLIEPQTGKPFHDLWDSFPTVRSQLLNGLAAATATPIIISGDVHIAVEAEARDIASDGHGATEWVTTSVTSQNLDDKMEWKPRAHSKHYEESFIASVPGVRWCDFDSHGFLLVTLERERASCEWWAVETVRERSENAWVVHRSHVDRRGSPTG